MKLQKYQLPERRYWEHVSSNEVYIVFGSSQDGINLRTGQPISLSVNDTRDDKELDDKSVADLESYFAQQKPKSSRTTEPQ